MFFLEARTTEKTAVQLDTKKRLFIMMFKILTCFIILSLLSPLSFATDEKDWENLCPNPDIFYCKNVEKTAYHGSDSPPHLRGRQLGKIIGVAWIPKGTIIGYEKPITEAGIPRKALLSPRSAFYYIIVDDVWKKEFLRPCLEIEVEKVKTGNELEILFQNKSSE